MRKPKLKCATCPAAAASSILFLFWAEDEKGVEVHYCLDCGRKPSCHFRGYVQASGRLPGNKALLRKAFQKHWIRAGDCLNAKGELVPLSAMPVPEGGAVNPLLRIWAWLLTLYTPVPDPHQPPGQADAT